MLICCYGQAGLSEQLPAVAYPLLNDPLNEPIFRLMLAVMPEIAQCIARRVDVKLIRLYSVRTVLLYAPTEHWQSSSYPGCQ